MNTDLLKGAIRGAGYTQKKFAAEIPMSLGRFNAKLNNKPGAEFTESEMRRVAELLRFDPRITYEIFLG